MNRNASRGVYVEVQRGEGEKRVFNEESGKDNAVLRHKHGGAPLGLSGRVQGLFTADWPPASNHSVLAAKRQSYRLDLYVKTNVTRVQQSFF